MHILFRVDASVQIGTGHLMRCLTLADELSSITNQIGFIMRELPGHLCEYVEARGYDVYRLYVDGSKDSLDSIEGCQASVDGSGDNIDDSHDNMEGRGRYILDAEETLSILHLSGAAVDWLIVDHYSLDYRWEQILRPAVSRIMVMDDLADRRHDCDIVLDQNYVADMETRYDGLVPAHCVKLLGPRHALLRPEFKEARLASRERERDGTVRRMFVFYGGSDPTNETAKALRALQRLSMLGDEADHVQVDVIVGSANPYKEQIQGLCLSLQFTYHCQVENMAYYMSKADLCLGAGGASTWERLFLGLPAITTVIAENQAEITAAVEETGTIWNLGWHAEVSVEDVAAAVKEALEFPDKLKQMGDKAFLFMEDTCTEGDHFIVSILTEVLYEQR